MYELAEAASELHEGLYCTIQIQLDRFPCHSRRVTIPSRPHLSLAALVPSLQVGQQKTYPYPGYHPQANLPLQLWSPSHHLPRPTPKALASSWTGTHRENGPRAVVVYY